MTKLAQPGKATTKVSKPWPVAAVTGAALVLPGVGQILNGNATRGTVMQFFMMALALATYLATGPEISMVGRFSGGVFIYVISVLDAYQIARRRSAAYGRLSAG
jgi:hypothetical protein